MGGGGGWGRCITLDGISWYSVCAAQQGMVFTNKDLIVKQGIQFHYFAS